MKNSKRSDSKILTSNIGLFAILLFLSATLVFGILNGQFNFLNDNVSKLGSIGQPYAIWFNIIGFVGVGVLLSYFGYSYGKILNDIIIAILLGFFGISFSFLAVPVNLEQPLSNFENPHVIVLSLGLISWLLALTRISSKRRIKTYIKFRANLATALVIIGISTVFFNFWHISASATIVIGIIFLWTILSCIDLRKNKYNSIWK